MHTYKSYSKSSKELESQKNPGIVHFFSLCSVVSIMETNLADSLRISKIHLKIFSYDYFLGEA